MSSIVIPYKICPLVNSSTIVMNYPDSYTVHVEGSGKVLVWPSGYSGECREYDSVHHHNGWPDKPRRVNSDTHLGYDWSGGGEMELEEGQVIEEEGEVVKNEEEEEVFEEEVEFPSSLYRKLESEIVELNYLLQLKQTYLEQGGALEQGEREAVEEEIFSLGITLARKKNFFTAVSDGLSFDNSGEIEKKIQRSEKKVRDKRTTKAFRRDRETARLNKSGFRFQVDEDEAEEYVAKKQAEAEAEAEAEADLLEDADYAERFEKRIRSLLV